MLLGLKTLLLMEPEGWHNHKGWQAFFYGPLCWSLSAVHRSFGKFYVIVETEESFSLVVQWRYWMGDSFASAIEQLAVVLKINYSSGERRTKSQDSGFIFIRSYARTLKSDELLLREYMIPCESELGLRRLSHTEELSVVTLLFQPTNYAIFAIYTHRSVNTVSQWFTLFKLYSFQ
jgi:hypothetical protein